MGVKVSGQSRPSAVIVGLRRRLNCANVEGQAHCLAACSVRIEGVRGSIPSAPASPDTGPVVCWIQEAEEPMTAHGRARCVPDQASIEDILWSLKEDRNTR
jgi:hypothetical protein